MQEANDTANAQANVSNPQTLEEMLNKKKVLLADIYKLEVQFMQFDPRQMGQVQMMNQRATLLNTLPSKKEELIHLEAEIDQHLMDDYKNFQKKREDFEISAEAANDSVVKLKGLADNATQIAKDALDTATNAAGIASAKPLIEHFSTRKDELGSPIKRWMGFTILFFALTLGFILFVNHILDKPNPDQLGDVILYISSKVIIVALLVSAMIWCGKLFKDSYDKREFYQHKIAITKTYKVFMESTKESEVKDAVLKESLKHIFSSPPTSHDAPKAEIEIIKAVPDIIKAVTGRE
jgi:hypothetical protein